MEESTGLRVGETGGDSIRRPKTMREIVRKVGPVRTSSSHR